MKKWTLLAAALLVVGSATTFASPIIAIGHATLGCMCGMPGC